MKDVYVVTGGGSGIGLDIAKQFIGKTVLIADISEENMSKAKAELLALNVNVETCVTDLSNGESIAKLFEYAKSLGKVKVVINSAGVSGTLGNSKKIFEINLLGSKVLLDNAIDAMSEGGSIVLISSMVGHTVFNENENEVALTYPEREGSIDQLVELVNNEPDQAYNYSKLGVLNLLKRYAYDAGAKGIRVNSVSPGVIMTPMSIKAQEEHPETMDYLKSITPLRRMGEVEDISNAVNFLLSDKSSFITGTDILVDGGIVTKLTEVK